MQIIEKINIAKLSLIVIFILGLYVLFGYISNKYMIYFNFSNSFSQKVFIATKKFSIKDISLNEIVVFKNRFKDTYVPKGELMVKRIVCKEGDNLTKRGNSFFCNNKLVAIALDKDSKNRNIKSFSLKDINVVPYNKIFVTAENPKSYDSRYYGLIDKTEIVGVVLWKF